ncbi:unnamed protein product [Mytilus edulis]|uniref:Uncharacterized protein n=1 Tax=Mytilus edulis TaxID=6550 RepID=A0A8S3UVG2_MYTED|nr:unnamed protein product [Mytilus edulis]
MKQPTAPDLYPELPIEDGQNYRLQKISEIENSLKNERDKRNSLYKKYKRGVNFTDGIDTTLISASVISAGIGIAIPILLPLQITAVACGSVGMNKMAEGGNEFDNPVFEINDYDDDYDNEEKTPLIDNDDEEFQNYINKEFENSRALSENDAKIRKKMIKQFYKKNGETTRSEIGFLVREDYKGNQILYVKDEKALFKKEYGVNFVRDVLGVDDFKISDNLREARADFQDFQRTIKAPIRELDYIEIPLQEISTQQEGQELLEIASNEETHVKEIETSFIEQGTSYINEETQTYMTREMDGIISAMTSVKEEIANELTKLNETNKDLAKENAKLEQAKEDNDEFQIDRISSRIRELESERSARLEVININKEKLRSQVNRFKQTIHKMLNEDKTLGERIRTLFREQGITIVSVLTAFGMIIGVIVEAFTGSPSPSPPSKGGGVQDWIKKQLKNLGKLLSFLAGKISSCITRYYRFYCFLVIVCNKKT